MMCDIEVVSEYYLDKYKSERDIFLTSIIHNQTVKLITYE